MSPACCCRRQHGRWRHCDRGRRCRSDAALWRERPSAPCHAAGLTWHRCAACGRPMAASLQNRKSGRGGEGAAPGRAKAASAACAAPPASPCGGAKNSSERTNCSANSRHATKKKLHANLTVCGIMEAVKQGQRAEAQPCGSGHAGAYQADHNAGEHQEPAGACGCAPIDVRWSGQGGGKGGCQRSLQQQCSLQPGWPQQGAEHLHVADRNPLQCQACDQRTGPGRQQAQSASCGNLGMALASSPHCDDFGCGCEIRRAAVNGSTSSS